MLLILVRTLILFIIAIITVRLMGKKEVGQLQPYELVIAILIADLAAAPIANTGVPLLYGIIPMIVLLACHAIIAFLSLKSAALRGIISGKPSIVIKNGVIDEAELKKLDYNLNDLIEQLRLKDVFDIRDADFAILEPNGNLSVLKKEQVTSGMPSALIFDGKAHLKSVDDAIDERWLERHVKTAGFPGVTAVLYASIDNSGTLFMQGKLPDPRSVYLPTKELGHGA